MTPVAEVLDCGHPPSPTEGPGTGYGLDAAGKKSCYACCAEADKVTMRSTGRITLYLTRRQDGGFWMISNWPGSLLFKATYFKKGRHNMAGSRYDVWFNFEGSAWHGVNYGENTQLLHCRRIKS